jgi:cbb3-type cytochrome oxidase maturation protein
MTEIAFLIPVALIMGAIGLIAFFWSLKTNQYDDLDGAANRILMDDEDDDAEVKP